MHCLYRLPFPTNRIEPWLLVNRFLTTLSQRP
jgi:hypothetical protein